MHPARFPLILFLVLPLVKPACAADSAGKDIPYATREQYRACLDSDDRLKERRKTLDERISGNRAELEQIVAEARKMVDEQKRLDTSNAARVADFNRRTDEHNQMIRAARERAEKTKAEQDAFRAELLEHNAQCSTLVVRLSDREAVLKERRTAATATPPNRSVGGTKAVNGEPAAPRPKDER